MREIGFQNKLAIYLAKFPFCRLVKWEKLGLQYKVIGWCPNTKRLLARRLPLELLIFCLDGKFYDIEFSDGPYSYKETCLTSKVV